MYKILSKILLSRLTPYAQEIIWDHQLGPRWNRLNTYHIVCIHREKVGIQWSSSSAIYRPQESLWFSWKRGHV
jgi:hypothetical protein